MITKGFYTNYNITRIGGTILLLDHTFNIQHSCILNTYCVDIKILKTIHNILNIRGNRIIQQDSFKQTQSQKIFEIRQFITSKKSWQRRWCPFKSDFRKSELDLKLRCCQYRCLWQLCCLVGVKTKNGEKQTYQNSLVFLFFDYYHNLRNRIFFSK